MVVAADVCVTVVCAVAVVADVGVNVADIAGTVVVFDAVGETVAILVAIARVTQNGAVADRAAANTSAAVLLRFSVCAVTAAAVTLCLPLQLPLHCAASGVVAVVAGDER